MKKNILCTIIGLLVLVGSVFGESRFDYLIGKVTDNWEITKVVTTTNGELNNLYLSDKTAQVPYKSTFEELGKHIKDESLNTMVIFEKCDISKKEFYHTIVVSKFLVTEEFFFSDGYKLLYATYSCEKGEKLWKETIEKFGIEVEE